MHTQRRCPWPRSPHTESKLRVGGGRIEGDLVLTPHTSHIFQAAYIPVACNFQSQKPSESIRSCPSRCGHCSTKPHPRVGEPRPSRFSRLKINTPRTCHSVPSLPSWGGANCSMKDPQSDREGVVGVKTVKASGTAPVPPCIHHTPQALQWRRLSFPWAGEVNWKELVSLLRQKRKFLTESQLFQNYRGCS